MSQKICLYYICICYNLMLLLLLLLLYYLKKLSLSFYRSVFNVVVICFVTFYYACFHIFSSIIFFIFFKKKRRELMSCQWSDVFFLIVPIIKPAFNCFASMPYFVSVCGECVLLHVFVCVSVGYSVCAGRAAEASGSGWAVCISGCSPSSRTAVPRAHWSPSQVWEWRLHLQVWWTLIVPKISSI